ncbi:TRAP transporter substrate-binding protein [Marinivivus vitaminiproducens]|uniref:TRAP transporter substrate-binding protein n=1 Tax=Marinivivus vitaminiproducens TaxID=3035935 RepID=UPI0027A1AEEC|nr:TRAP transporter substrate-binding protein [Geminicoccaceae bacterium SCSIO 64248]
MTRMGVAALLALGIGTSVPATAFAQTTLRYAHVGFEGDIQYWYAEEIAKRVNDQLGERVEINVFPAAQLGGVQETIDGVRSGAISMAHHEFSSLAQVYPEIAVLNAPFIYRDGEHAMTVTDPGSSELMQEFNDGLIEAGGMRIIGRLYRGARQMTAKKPVYAPADLANERFRGVPIQLWTSMITGFGAIPTPVEVQELPTALLTGMVIGQENPLTMINANKLYEVQSHVMLTSHMQNVLPLFINEDVWQSLEEADREAIATIAEEVGQETLERGLAAENDLIAELTDKGMTFITVDNGLKLDEFRESVGAQITQDFPSWEPYMARIAEVQ